MRPDVQSVGHANHFHYRPAVDGLRGIAVLAVLGFHAFADVVPGGYIGVDIFFVISGFLITSIVARAMEHRSFSFAQFYGRRVRRLFPALILVLLSTLTLGWLLLLPDEFKQLGKHVSAAAAFLANFAFWRESGYFDISAELKPLLHLWSLGIEEQFYLAWPAVMAVFWKRKALLLTVLAMLIVASFILSVALSHSAPIANFYSPATRFWELGAGCLLALVREPPSSNKFSLSEAQLNIVSFSGLALILTSLVAFDDTTPFPGWAALAPVIGTLLILAPPESGWLQRHVLGSRPLVWTGLISYALYLWHWPLLSFLNILEAGSPPAVFRGLALGLSFVLAWLTYRFIEVPIRRRKEFKINLRLAVSAAAAGIAGLIVYATSGVAQRFDADVQALRAGPRQDDLCRARFDDALPINYCRATSTQPPEVLFVGDSRAHAIYEAALPLLEMEPRMMLLGRGGCPPLLNVRIRGYDANESECADVWRTFVRYVQQTRPRVVVVVGNGSFLITRRNIQLTREHSAAPEPKEQVFEHGLRSLLRELSTVSRVIYVGEIPTFVSAPSCFLRAVRLPTTQCHPERNRDQIETAMAPYNRVLARVQVAFPQVHLIDAVESLCGEDVCSQRPPGKPVLYSDAIHLSPAGARLLIEDTNLPELISRQARIAAAGRSSLTSRSLASSRQRMMEYSFIPRCRFQRTVFSGSRSSAGLRESHWRDPAPPWHRK